MFPGFKRRKLCNLLPWIFTLCYLEIVTCISLTDVSCSTLQSFKCTAGGICINSSLVCDNVYDCADGSDENGCDKLCPDGWFHCLNDNCILLRWHCDGHDDCGDHSDELNCGHISGSCSHEEFRCHDNSKCIPLSWVCDGSNDCKDVSDEAPGCSRQVPCDGFECRSHECVPRRWHCDGTVDCEDGSDESNCSGAGANASCAETQLQFYCADRSDCLAEPLVCNGIKNCVDGSDEGGQCDEHTCNSAGCSHGCFQTPRKAMCYCPPGYELVVDAKTCKDVDECSQYGSCSQMCANSVGSYVCSCAEGYVLQDNHRTCKLRDPEPILVYSANRELKVVKLRTGLAYTIHGQLSRAVGVDYDSQEDRVFWSEIDDSSEAIKSSRLDGSDVKTLVTNGISIVEDVAIDWIGRNIYFTDSGLYRLVVCGVDGVHCAVLLDDLLQPRALVLDPIVGIMFWSDWSHSPSIDRSGMDGSDRRQLVTSNLGWPNGLAFDSSLKCIYWVDGKMRRVESVDVDGGNRRVVFEDVMLHPFSLAVLEDTFYWTDWSRHTLESCDKFTGGDHKVLMRESSDNRPMGVHAYHPVVQPTSNNPCWRSACSQLCLIAPDAGHRCVCQAGSALSADGVSCGVSGNATARVFLSSDDTVYRFHEAVIGRSDLEPLAAKAKLSIGVMAHDAGSDALFYSDLGSKELVVVDLKTEKQKVLMSSHVDTVQGLAVDHVAGNLYWTDAARYTLEVVRTDGQHRRLLLENLLGHPMAIALLPAKGFMFMAVIGARPRIEKLDMDGTDRHVFLDYEVSSPTSLTVDHSAERLYWTDVGLGKVEWASLDGKQRYALKNYGGWPSAVAVSLERIWWADAEHDILMWMGKDPGSMAHSFSLQTRGGKPDSHLGLLVVDPVSAKGSNGCAVSNGQCSHLCLANQLGYICACPTGMQMSADHKTCQLESKCNSHEFACGDGHCIPLTFTCDTVKDCDDGSDETNCQRSCTSQEFRCSDGHCIPVSWQCDHRNDCDDHSDESMCTNETGAAKPMANCSAGMFTCRSGECVHATWQCDGETDCADRSDEDGCVATCKVSEFTCKSGQCVPSSWQCDGEVDCRDGSDEDATCQTSRKECKKHHEFTCDNGRCVESDLVCDGDDDCGDGSDEAHCTPKSCPSNMFQCGTSHKCILSKTVCDGVKDCVDGEDEADCKAKTCRDDEFECAHSKTCILKSWLCDGENDCDDLSDETQPECHNTETPPPSPSTTVSQADDEKRYIHGDEHEDDDDDDHHRHHHYQETSTDAAVGRKLNPVKAECSHDQYRCDSGDCVPLVELCNHRQDCEDGSDEGSFCATSCGSDNGGCSDVCFPTPAGSRCWCRSGFYLDHDGKTCHDIDECEVAGMCSHTCINMQGAFTCSCDEGYHLRSDHTSCKAEGPSPYLLLAFTTKLLSYTLGGNHVQVVVQDDKINIKDMDFDTRTGDIYWVDYNEGILWKYSAHAQAHNSVLEGLKSPTVIALDWINKVLFYYDAEGDIVVCTMNGVHCARIFQAGHRNVASMVLHPLKGYVYWSTWSDDSSDTGDIKRMNMNGKRPILFASGKLIWPTGLTIDFVHDLLYWVDVHLQVIESAQLNGEHRAVVSRREITYPMSLTLFEDHIFWADWGQNVVVKCDKWTCEDREVVLQHVTKVHKLSVLHPVQQPNGSSPCLAQKKCSHLCVKLPAGFACLCPEGMKFEDKHNTSCVASSVPSPRYDMSRCTSQTCNNGGTCIMKDGGRARCLCPPAYEGRRCENRQSKYATAMTEPDDGDSKAWIAGVVIGILFVMALVVAVMWYCRRHDIDKFRGAFAPVPFVNPVFDENGDPQDEDPDAAYRSYSNPLFDGSNRNEMMYNVKEDKVQFHVSASSTSLDSAFASESQSSNNLATIIDLTQKQKLLP